MHGRTYCSRRAGVRVGGAHNFKMAGDICIAGWDGWGCAVRVN